MYLPAFLLLLLAFWYALLVLANFYSDRGKSIVLLWSLLLVSASVYLFYWDQVLRNPEVWSGDALRMYIGIGLIAMAGPIKTRAIQAVLIGLGTVLAGSIYVSL